MNGKFIGGILLVIGGGFQLFLLMGGALQAAVTGYYFTNPIGLRMFVPFRIPTQISTVIAGLLIMILDRGEKKSMMSGGFLVGNAVCSMLLLAITWLQVLVVVILPFPLMHVLWVLLPACIAMFGIFLAGSETGKVKKAGLAFLLYACIEAFSIVSFLLVPDITDLYLLYQLITTCWAGAHVFWFIGAILLMRINK